jgi:hypothetical protein
VSQTLKRAGLAIFVLTGLCLPGFCFGQAIPKTARGESAAPADPNAPKGVFPTSHGVIKSISGSQLFVEVDDEHEMKFRMTHKTKIFVQSKDGKGKIVSKEVKTSSLQPGQTVDIDMESSLDGAFEAVRVMVLPSSPQNVEPNN